MQTSLVAPRSDDSSDGLERLSTLQFCGVLGLALVLFLFEAGPVWRHPWDMNLVNRAVYWSYVPIPILVMVCLAWSRRLSIRAFFLDTMTIVLIKYATTFALALVLWEVTPVPRVVQAPSPPRSTPTAEERSIVPTPLDPARIGAIDGSVMDAAGRPVAGALVWIAGGLEGFTFAPDSAPISLVNTGAAMSPDIAVVAAGQPILARSLDGQLHTMVAERDGKTLFNVPLLASGEPSHARFHDAEGLVTLRCNVHPGAAEAAGRVVVIDNPFFARTDAAGRFTLRGVPAAHVTLSAHDGRRSAEATIDVPPGGDARAPLTFSGAPSMNR